MFRDAVCFLVGHKEPDIMVSDAGPVWRCPRCRVKTEPPERIQKEEYNLRLSEALQEIEESIQRIVELRNMPPAKEGELRAQLENILGLLIEIEMTQERRPPFQKRSADIAALMIIVKAHRQLCAFLKQTEEYLMRDSL